MNPEATRRSQLCMLVPIKNMSGTVDSHWLFKTGYLPLKCVSMDRNVNYVIYDRFCLLYGQLCKLIMNMFKTFENIYTVFLE